MCTPGECRLDRLKHHRRFYVYWRAAQGRSPEWARDAENAYICERHLSLHICDGGQDCAAVVDGGGEPGGCAFTGKQCAGSVWPEAPSGQERTVEARAAHDDEDDGAHRREVVTGLLAGVFSQLKKLAGSHERKHLAEIIAIATEDLQRHRQLSTEHMRKYRPLIQAGYYRAWRQGLELAPLEPEARWSPEANYPYRAQIACLAEQAEKTWTSNCYMFGQ